MCLSDYEFSRHLCSPKHFTFTLLTFIVPELYLIFVSPLCSYQIYVILLLADLECYPGWDVFWRIILPNGGRPSKFYYGMGPWPLSRIADILLSNPPDVYSLYHFLFQPSPFPEEIGNPAGCVRRTLALVESLSWPLDQYTMETFKSTRTNFRGLQLSFVVNFCLQIISDVISSINSYEKRM